MQPVSVKQRPKGHPRLRRPPAISSTQASLPHPTTHRATYPKQSRQRQRLKMPISAEQCLAILHCISPPLPKDRLPAETKGRWRDPLYLAWFREPMLSGPALGCPCVTTAQVAVKVGPNACFVALTSMLGLAAVYAPLWGGMSWTIFLYCLAGLFVPWIFWTFVLLRRMRRKYELPRHLPPMCGGDENSEARKGLGFFGCFSDLLVSLACYPFVLSQMAAHLYNPRERFEGPPPPEPTVDDGPFAYSSAAAPAPAPKRAAAPAADNAPPRTEGPAAISQFYHYSGAPSGSPAAAAPRELEAIERV